MDARMNDGGRWWSEGSENGGPMVRYMNNMRIIDGYMV